MALEDFEGDTFVAFMDISGFKIMMADPKEAWRKLDIFYNYAYQVLRQQKDDRIPVEGLFVSDSGILFVRNKDGKKCLNPMLKVIRDINKKMLKHEIMLTTSIAFGHFKYQERIEFPGIGKDPIYGNAYVSAFLDNENGTPKIQPGQCRIINSTLPEGYLHEHQENLLKFIKEREGDQCHAYFYWMIDEDVQSNINSDNSIFDRINKFEKLYNDSYNLKYAGMLKALKQARYDHRNQ